MKYPKNSFVKDKDGDVRKVLEAVGDLRFLSCGEGKMDNWETTAHSYFFLVKELERMSCEECPAPAVKGTSDSSTPFKPKTGEFYWYIDFTGDVWECRWDDDEPDNYRLRTNNVFRTEKEAEERYKEIMK